MKDYACESLTSLSFDLALSMHLEHNMVMADSSNKKLLFKSDKFSFKLTPDELANGTYI